MRTMLTAVAAAIMGVATPAAAAECWGVKNHPATGKSFYVHFDERFYIEYREWPVPVADVDLKIVMTIERDIESDRLTYADFFLQASDKETGETLFEPMPMAFSKSGDKGAFGPKLSANGGLILYSQRPNRHQPVTIDGLLAQQMLNHVLAGKPIEFTGSYGTGRTILAGAYFLPDAAYQTYIRTQSRALLAEYRRTGHCPKG